jgi:hypothetical protein
MQEVVDVIRTARNVAKANKHRIANLETDDLFPYLSLRVKAGGSAPVKTFKFPVGSDRDLIPIEIETFYKDRHPFSSKQPKPGSEFFRVGIRIERPKSN